MEKESIEVSDRELRQQQAEKVEKFLIKIKAFEYVEKLRLDKKNTHFSFEDFKDFLIRINGMLRDIDMSKRGIDGQNVYISGAYDSSLVPKPEDKIELLKKAYDALDKIKVGDEAYLLPVVINAVHLFADGNGRTSRLINNLLMSSSEADFLERLKVAIDKNGRFETADINPSLIRADIDKILLMRHGIEFEDNGQYSPIYPQSYHFFAQTEVPNQPKAREFMFIRSVDGAFASIVANQYLIEKDLINKVLINATDVELISPLKMEKELTNEGWEEIIRRYYQLKKEAVEILIDMFITPDSYTNLDGSMSLKDAFIGRIIDKL